MKGRRGEQERGRQEDGQKGRSTKQIIFLFMYIQKAVCIISYFQRMIEKQKWRSVNTVNNGSCKPSPRWGHSNCVIGEDVVLFGGYADSIYMNDLWIFNSRSMQWAEVKTSGDIPSHRSNCSLNYDPINNKIIMFGGGGSNKTRFNSINLLDWNTKVWTEITPKENETAPWQRTYHSAELLYPYLIVYGGEGVADLDDIWVYNFQTQSWTEIPIEKGAIKPCARRFHSSCLIGNQFYVIAGCHTKYRCLNDIYSIDLTSLAETGSVEGMQWKERSIKGYAFLTRWGHTSAAYNDKIYIFGGRFSNDLNDLLVFDPSKDQLKALKVAPDTLPKPRRRPSTCFIGSCLLMFGGFNQDYYNDLHFINVGLSTHKPKKMGQNSYNFLKFINNQEASDCVLHTKENKPFYCHRGFIRKNFQTHENMVSYLDSIDYTMTEKELVSIMRALYLGFGSISDLYKHGGYLPSSEQEKQTNFLRYVSEAENGSSQSSNIFIKPGKKIKMFCNFIACVGDNHYGDFLQKNRDIVHSDSTIIINGIYKLDVCSSILRAKSNFFNNMFSSHFKHNDSKSMDMKIPGNIVLFQILINFLMSNFLVVPESMTWLSWIELFDLADFLALKNVKEIVVHYLENLINEESVKDIFEFSQKQNIEDLALICARFQIKSAASLEKDMRNVYVCRAYSMNRFQLAQNCLTQPQLAISKKKSSSDSMEMEGEKENYQISN